MAEIEPPSDLVQRFREGRVSLFIGAGCCRGAGLPTWKELLEQVRDHFEKGYLLNKEDRGRIKAWFRKPEDYPRIAQLFKDRSPQHYREIMQGLFDPAGRAAFRPPRYFHLFRQLPVSRVLTTNFDKLLEDALGPAWGSLTWDDNDEMPRYLRETRHLVFHIHGRADRYGTLVHTYSEYQELQKQRGSQAREFLKRIFEANTILFVGYSLSDPVIRWIRDQLLSDWGIAQPDWMLLIPDPTEEQRNRERRERGLRLVGYPLDPELNQVDRNAAHEVGLSAWFEALAGRLGIEVAGPDPSAPMDFTDSGCIPINQAYLDGQPRATPELCRRYYRGEPVRWSLVRDGYTARRKATDEVLGILDGEGMRAVLLNGPGGEGKTTVLMQIGLELLRRDFDVYFMSGHDGDPVRVLRASRRPLALLLDNADEFRNVVKLLNAADHRAAPTRIVMAARSNDWRQAQHRLGDANRLFTTVNMAKLTLGEAREIAQRLVETGIVDTGRSEGLADHLVEDTNGFLLAAMLTATRGEPLARILADVVRKVSDWPRGDELLTGLACVVALEARRDAKGNHYWCSLRLFAEAMGVSKQEVLRICGRLVGEVSLHARGGYRVETRHPVIASTLFPILFRSEVPFADEMEIHERLLWAAGRLSREHVKAGERNLLSILPRVYRQEGDLQRARQLFRIATKADPMQAPTWQAWAHMESEAGNIGATDQPESARWLFQRATEVDPHDIPAWQAWAVMEGKAENVGDLEKPFTARWLFNKATEIDPRQAPIWQAWAHLEDRLGNRGDVRKPYTARWLFWKATEADPTHAPSWQAWAILESDPETMGALDQKHSARWLFRKATQADPKDALSWQAWARMEAKARNMGEVEQEHTARWLFRKAVEVKPEDAASWHAWAESERQFGSVERAREILRDGLQRCPTASELLSLQEQYRHLADGEVSGVKRIQDLVSAGDLAAAEAALRELRLKREQAGAASPDAV